MPSENNENNPRNISIPLPLRLSKTERRVTFDISRIFAFRMLGLFMILPIFSLYAEGLTGSTPFLIGIALGIYGFASAIMQTLMGVLSDKLGRKKIITFGLFLFLIGSVIAGASHSIEGVIAGRCLQGLGAIGSSLLALLADHTREEVRFKAMSMIGMTIGLTFILSMILGPVLSQFIGLSGIFYFMGVLACIGLLIVWFRIPSLKNSKNKKIIFHGDQEFSKKDFKKIAGSFELWRLNLGVFILHAVLTGTFVILPLLLVKSLGMPLDKQWELYLPVLIIAFALMFPFIIWSEKKKKLKILMIGSVGLLVLLELGFFYGAVRSFGWVVFLLILFFAVFTLLEASMPSLVSKISPGNAKGTAMGLYATMQFLGIFFGGALSGYFLGENKIQMIFLGAAVLCFIWFLLVLTMKNPPHWATRLVKLNQVNDDVKKSLEKIEGVHEVSIDPEENIAYLKVDTAVFDDEKIFGYSENLFEKR